MTRVVVAHRGPTRARAPQAVVPGRRVVAVTSDDAVTAVVTPGRTVVAQRLSVPIAVANGGAIAGAYTYYEYTASAQWVFPHPLGRTPQVSVYLLDGIEIEADVDTTATMITVTFNRPMRGYVVVS